ncbi:MAG: glycosyltransferase family 39 protein [Candidatus Wallbacteria bacterium]|nr:glycosyltransferase family 39 protein [Candidatus Wallbacteria bacterium]
MSLWTLGWACVGAHGLLAWSSLGAQSVPVFLALMATSSLLWAVAVARVLRRTGETSDTARILAIGIALRLVALVGEPMLDDDFYRYAWDARVGASGVNPYLHPPASLALEELRDDDWGRVSYPTVRTVYPPAAQWLFRAGAALAGGRSLGIRVLLVLLDIATMALIADALGALGIPRRQVLLYAWNPLVVKELANSGHIDGLAVFLVAAAVWCWVREDAGAEPGSRFGLLGAAALGLGTLAKLYPAVLAPLVLRGLRQWLIAAAVVCAGYLPYRDAGELLLDGIRTYGLHWEFNGSLFPVLSALLAQGPGWLPRAAGAAVPFAVGAWWRIRHGAEARQRISGSLAVLGSLFLFTPAAQVWYLCWLAPLVPFLPSRPWLLLMATSSVAYAYYLNGCDLWWIRPLEYGPPLALAAAGLVGRIRRRSFR